MARQGTGRSVTEQERTPSIPDKLYFRIGEVAALCGVPAYVLRFWESEFPQLKPNKGGTGQRLYRRRDVEVALRIRALLYEGKYTIPGARQALRAEQRQPEPQLSLAIVDTEATHLRGTTAEAKAVGRLRRDLLDLLDLLSSPQSARAGSVQPIRRERALPVRKLHTGDETAGSRDLFS